MVLRRWNGADRLSRFSSGFSSGFAWHVSWRDERLSMLRQNKVPVYYGVCWLQLPGFHQTVSQPLAPSPDVNVEVGNIVGWEAEN